MIVKKGILLGWSFHVWAIKEGTRVYCPDKIFVHLPECGYSKLVSYT